MMGRLKRFFNRGEHAVPPAPSQPGSVTPLATAPGLAGVDAPVPAPSSDNQLPTTLMTGVPMNTTEPEDVPSAPLNAPAPVDPPATAEPDFARPPEAAPATPLEESVAPPPPAAQPAPENGAEEGPAKDPMEEPPIADAAPDPSAAPEAPPAVPEEEATGTEEDAPPGEDIAAPPVEPAPAAEEEEVVVEAPRFPAVGATIGGRYVLTGTLGTEEASALLGGTVPVVDAELYAVEDTRAYERCWSCGSTANGESQRFCMDCGAPLQHRQLVLARTLAAKGEAEEFSEDGAFFHLVRPRKQFGNAGMTLEVGACSAEGPHHPNEDSYWTAAVGGCFDSKSEMFGVAVLADGMGGYAPGSGLISKMIVSSVGRSVFHLLHAESETEKQDMEIQAVIRSAVAEANSRVLDEIHVHGEMGATLVVAVVYGQCAYIANIGDSRAYYIAPSGAVTQITRDQSLIEQQVAAGVLSADAAYTAFGNNVILHAIGEERVEEAFDWYLQPLEPGGRLLLCSDGYWKIMRRDVWDAEMAASRPTLRDLARSMVESALSKGSDDNTTVVLVGID